MKKSVKIEIPAALIDQLEADINRVHIIAQRYQKQHKTEVAALMVNDIVKARQAINQGSLGDARYMLDELKAWG